MACKSRNMHSGALEQAERHHDVPEGDASSQSHMLPHSVGMKAATAFECQVQAQCVAEVRMADVGHWLSRRPSFTDHPDPCQFDKILNCNPQEAPGNHRCLYGISMRLSDWHTGTK